MEDRTQETTNAVLAATVSETRGETLVQTIVRVVSEVESRFAYELPPLYDAIDPDALQTICGQWAEHTRDGSRAVSFEYSDSRVLVEHGTVTVATHVR